LPHFCGNAPRLLKLRVGGFEVRAMPADCGIDFGPGWRVPLTGVLFRPSSTWGPSDAPHLPVIIRFQLCLYWFYLTWLGCPGGMLFLLGGRALLLWAQHIALWTSILIKWDRFLSPSRVPVLVVWRPMRPFCFHRPFPGCEFCFAVSMETSVKAFGHVVGHAQPRSIDFVCWLVFGPPKDVLV